MARRNPAQLLGLSRVSDPQLEAWDNFYVIVGSSAAALTGLMFVVIALIADDTSGAQVEWHGCRLRHAEHRALLRRAYRRRATLSAPWRSITNVAAADRRLRRCGRGLWADRHCIVRDGRRRISRCSKTGCWHTVFPLASYTAIVIASRRCCPGTSERSLFAVAAAALSLVLIGIHNAWDTVICTLHGRTEPAERLTRHRKR